MATVTKTIGTISRDYSTITAWEADLDNASIYSTGDDTVGECYNDSTFTEEVILDGGGTVGLNSITLTVASGERHDGTAGTGVLLENAAFTFRNIYKTTTVTTTIEWLEITCATGGSNNSRKAIYIKDGSGTSIIKNNIIHNVPSPAYYSTTVSVFVYFDVTEAKILNNILYDIKNTKTGTSTEGSAIGVWSPFSNGVVTALNNTFFDITTAVTSSGGHGMKCADGVNNTVKNNISMGASTSDYDLGGISADSDYNLSSDATADDAGGANNIINKIASDQFVSTTSGSEDLHLKSGADAIDAGTDLGTTPAGVNIDINGYDRDAGGVVWDMGAHEFISSSTPISILYNLAIEFLLSLGLNQKINIDTKSNIKAGRQIPIEYFLSQSSLYNVPSEVLRSIGLIASLPVEIQRATILSVLQNIPVESLQKLINTYNTSEETLLYFQNIKALSIEYLNRVGKVLNTSSEINKSLLQQLQTPIGYNRYYDTLSHMPVDTLLATISQKNSPVEVLMNFARVSNMPIGTQGATILSVLNNIPVELLVYTSVGGSIPAEYTLALPKNIVNLSVDSLLGIDAPIKYKLAIETLWQFLSDDSIPIEVRATVVSVMAKSWVLDGRVTEWILDLRDTDWTLDSRGTNWKI